ncbi:DUF3995 domain-containing protein [Myroides sp. LoEW2-1]|uniref:DUF3995 domain-containing protein n=1 Tax=Myroides sp. LoEW2-1 TaxID=2683192 RepID=UPI0013217C9C|nr:DUF3995 domain-containing protein [Myroides sp. LoEW2-1]MVX37161.1 DUF3995 domain-containing protein [Myroides sp. LoEW2-1]
MTLFSIIQFLNFVIFIFLSFIHFYWAFGGKRALDCVLPSQLSGKVFKPSVLGTICVAFFLLFFGVFPYILVGYVNYLYLLLFVLFGLRVIGDFKYVGIFKKITNTTFAICDKKYFIPLCIYLSVLF